MPVLCCRSSVVCVCVWATGAGTGSDASTRTRRRRSRCIPSFTGRCVWNQPGSSKSINGRRQHSRRIPPKSKNEYSTTDPGRYIFNNNYKSTELWLFCHPGYRPEGIVDRRATSSVDVVVILMRWMHIGSTTQRRRSTDDAVIDHGFGLLLAN